MSESHFAQKTRLQTGQVQKQQLMMASKQMQKAISFLQASQESLKEMLKEEILKNPLLELETPNKNEEFLGERTISYEHNSGLAQQDTKHLMQDIVDVQNPRQSLAQQVRDIFAKCCETEVSTALLLVEHFNPKGIIDVSLESISLDHNIPKQRLEAVQSKFKLLQPSGIGALSTQESFSWQLQEQLTGTSQTTEKYKHLKIAKTIVDKYWEYLLKNRIKTITQETGIHHDQITKVMQNIVLNLDFAPMQKLHDEINPLSTPTSIAIEPDIYINVINNHITATVHQEDLSLNIQLINALKQATLSAEKKYLKEHQRSGKWLLKTLEKRKITLNKIAAAIIKYQRAYFMGGEIKPLSLTFLAKEMNHAVSTLSRAVEGKWIASPRAIEPLKNLFPSSTKNPFLKQNHTQYSQEITSTTTVKNQIREMVEREDPENPLSDQAISTLLDYKNITCSRRTVAKYRIAMKIPKSTLRKNRKKPHLTL